MILDDTAKRSGYLLPLGAASPPELVGGKAGKLGDLLAAGFPVPPGFVLTTQALASFLSANALGPESDAAAIAAAPLPPDMAELIAAAAAALGGGPLAVRSSALAEDLAGASFAGQYESVLGVQGVDALIEAVRRCWASAAGARVAAYRASYAPGAAGGMAVLVQRLVPAEAAGVAFTANPVTGDRAETLVSAVRGLGERLVGGLASPDEWSVRGNDAQCRAAPEQAIDAAQALAVAELARRVERHYGTPQDIEWALAGGELYLLQARPITTLAAAAPAPIAVPVEPPPGRWERVASHYPQPLSPMHRSLWLPVINRGFKLVADAFGLLAFVEQREIGGWVYMRLAPFAGKNAPAPPAWLLPLLVRVLPPLRKRIALTVASVREHKAGALIDQWYAEWLPSLIERAARLRAPALAGLSDAELDAQLQATLELLADGMDIHLMLHSANTLLLAELAFACHELLGWGDQRVFAMLSGLSGKSTEPALKLAELARMARERPAVSALLVQPGAQTHARLAEADPEFAAAFDGYLHEYGCRALRYEVADPTVAEQPALVLSLLRDQIARAYDPSAGAGKLARQRAEGVAQARATLAGLPNAVRERFETALSRAERAYPVREENEFYTVSMPFAIVRYALLELGRRLAERGSIGAPDDVFLLELDEARQALRAGSNAHDTIQRRRGERAWVEQHPGPASYGGPPAPMPSFDAFPPEVQFAMRALLWSAGQIFGPAPTPAAGAAIQGIGASAGRYTGPARIIKDETEFGKLQPGDVLVCPITSPVWSVLFPTIGALVTDTGGMLSHSAIIAREYRVPAVVAAGNATSRLRDGQIVTVDGERGLVETATVE